MRKLRTVELALKLAKVRFGSPKDFKVVTGVAISPKKRLAIPNKLRKKIDDQLDNRHDVSLLPDKDVISLTGRIEAARRIEPTAYESLYRSLSKRRQTIREKQKASQRKPRGKRMA